MGTATRRRRPLVMLATYEERENLAGMLDAVWKACDVDVLVIDDSSPDGTGKIADEIARRDQRLTVVHRAEKGGVASAHVLAFRHALQHGYDVVVEMDADFSHNPEDIPRLLTASASADVVVGSRRVNGGHVVGRARWRNAVTHLGCMYARAVLRLAVRDCTGGFRCTRAAARRVLDLDRIQSHGYGFQIELNWAWSRAAVHCAEVPIVFRDRTVGRSKMSMRILVEALSVVTRLRTGRLPVALLSHQTPSAAVATAGARPS